ncbi:MULTISPECIES: pyridoxal phosphate-dependent decarboxylase family protein [unclassified Prochlorococcus]|uniref:pyridoxal phosphate-dependent decarboxylase family protein n=1 Tax=unclassified Prochlorococcus TaxID=2627481 RepID=UPI0005337FC6|nr:MULTISPECIES: pyridoxal-dependent decarboxylase [unclassified Prochlorococcus]KGG15358.1 Pyridoxal-dependent decarboxylase family protein [Prochlorococcus sp. MIT 0602]KGG17636.1 Pyridoxal-dependent decarboxylase family protein [Prochlorococcus sp. MIT 0603]
MEFFAPPDRTDPKFKSFLEGASSDLCEWLSSTTNRGPLPSHFELPDIGPRLDGLSSSEMLDDLQKIMAGSYQPSHPGALAHLDPPPLTSSIVGELIAAGLNNNLLAEELSPSITKLERSLCKWIANKFEMPETAGGVAVSGGSLTNLMALLVARSNANLLCDPKAVVLASTEAHVSIARAISVMGLPPEALVRVPTDNFGCMSIKSLTEQFHNIKSQEKKCFAIVATAGTTVRGSIDPLTQIADFCHKEKIWLHADAAIGGAFGLSSSTASLVKDISRANSVTVNPQKLLGITKTSSLLLVSDIKDLFTCFSTGYPYLEPSYGNDYQGGELGLQGTRPAEVIKLWLGLRQLGANGIQSLLDKSIDRRRSLYERLDKSKFDIITGPLHLIAFTPNDISKQDAEVWAIKLRKKLLEHGFMLSKPCYKNRTYLKAVMGNPHTKISHIDSLAELINHPLEIS